MTDILKDKIEATRKYEADRLRKGYQYALSLGFDSLAARMIRGWSKSRVDSLARERGLLKSK